MIAYIYRHVIRADSFFLSIKLKHFLLSPSPTRSALVVQYMQTFSKNTRDEYVSIANCSCSLVHGVTHQLLQLS